MKPDILARAILGAIIIDTQRCLNIAIEANVQSDLFFNLNHQIIFDEIYTHYSQNGVAPDEIQTMELLSAKDEWHNGLSNEFTLATSAVDTTAGFNDWIAQFVGIRQKDLEVKAYESYKTLRDDTPPDEIKVMHENCKALLDRIETLQQASEDEVKEGFTEIYDEMQKLIDGEKPKVYFSMNHLAEFLSSFGPIRKQELVILAARPGIGKSSLLNQAIKENIKQGQNGVLFNFEMSSSEIIEQFACIEGQHDSRMMRYNKRQIQDFIETSRQLEPIVNNRLKIFTKSENIKRMNSQLDLHVQKYGNPDFIAVDYLQLIQSSGSKDNRATQVGEVSRTLKKWTQTYNCPVIALSQLNRAGEADNRQPRLSDLRESGSIEQDANRVILIHCPMSNSSGLDQMDLPVQEILLIQAKCRKGPRGKISIAFKKCTTSFFGVAAERQEEII